MAELVGEGHQGHAADAGLDVLLRGVGGAALEGVGQHVAEGGDGRLDGDALVGDAEGVGAGLGVLQAVLAGVSRRHHHAVHAAGAERVDRHGGGEGGVDAARHAEDDAGEA